MEATIVLTYRQVKGKGQNVEKLSSEASEGPFLEEKYHLCGNGALVISWALFDVTRPRPHCLPTSCRFLRLIPTSCLICPSGFFTRTTPRVDFKEMNRTPHFPTRMSHSGLLCAAGTPGKRGPLFPLTPVALPLLTKAMATKLKVLPDHVVRI